MLRFILTGITLLCAHALLGKGLQIELPKTLKQYIAKISVDPIKEVTPSCELTLISKNVYRLKVSWELKTALALTSWDIVIEPNFQPQFHWAPHLTPTANHIINQHVFRSAAMIVTDSKHFLSIIPDVDLLAEIPKVDWFMDMNAKENKLVLGFADAKITDHVLYEKMPTTYFKPGKYEYAAYLVIDNAKAVLDNPFGRVNKVMWDFWGSKLWLKQEPLGSVSMEEYVKHTYDWAFKHWKEQVWQEFELAGKTVGAPTFIVNVTQSPNYPGEVNEREFRSIWNQAWFNSLRSASGLMRYAQRWNLEELKLYALKTKELALSFPQRNGFFSGLIATEMNEVPVGNNKFWRSMGWNTYYFGNSNRNPFTGDPKQAPYHVLDMSYTASLMLSWFKELEKDERLLHYARQYGDALIQIQRADGFFPAWLDLVTQKDMQVLSRSPESAMSCTFLLQLYELTGEDKYKSAALKAIDAVVATNKNLGQWEDFETYWSCSRYGSEELVGKKVERNNMFKQNTLSIYYLAQALYQAYSTTGNKRYLPLGQQVLDELLLWQAVWQPPYIHIQAFGGFGVMNADAEWNDSRQSLFAELIMNYGKTLNRTDYIQRGIAALKASFVLMYCPENHKTKEQWQKRWPFLGAQDYGFMMENYGHDGKTNREGLGIGEFTIYDWGNGAAAEAYNRILDHWGPAIFQTK